MANADNSDIDQSTVTKIMPRRESLRVIVPAFEPLKDRLMLIRSPTDTPVRRWRARRLTEHQREPKNWLRPTEQSPFLHRAGLNAHSAAESIAPPRWRTTPTPLPG